MFDNQVLIYIMLRLNILTVFRNLITVNVTNTYTKLSARGGFTIVQMMDSRIFVTFASIKLFY